MILRKRVVKKWRQTFDRLLVADKSPGTMAGGHRVEQWTTALPLQSAEGDVTAPFRVVSARLGRRIKLICRLRVAMTAG